MTPTVEIMSGTAYRFERLTNGEVLWSVQLCNWPSRFQIGVADTQQDARVEAAATEKELRRLALVAQDHELDRLGV